jgi:hypothetical protein
MIKTLLLLLGPNAVGKSAAALALMQRLQRAALVDSDWCRAMNPYNPDVATENVYALLKNYFRCPEVDLVVFPYGLHGDRQRRLDEVLDGLRADGIELSIYPVVIACSLEENIRRAQNDGRDDSRILRGIDNTFHFYDGFDCPRIDVTNLTAEQAAEEVLALIKRR